MSRGNLLYYINKIQSDEISHAELREFIEICISISLFILNKKHHSLKKVFADQGVGFDDAAVDAITPLFIKDDSLDLTGIHRSLLSWHKKIITEADAHFFVFRIIANRTEQTVRLILFEIDPLYGRILRNIVYKSGALGYKKVNYAGTTYLLDLHETEITGKVINEDHFDNIPLHISTDKFGINLPDIFNYIKNHTNYFPAIPLNELVVRLKNIYRDLNFNEIEMDNFRVDLEIKYSVEKSLAAIYNKIEVSYIKKGILSIEEGDVLKSALKEVSVDLMDGGIQHGIEVYLEPYFIHLTKTEIREKYRNILDYLIRMLKKEIFKEFDSNNFPK